MSAKRLIDLQIGSVDPAMDNPLPEGHRKWITFHDDDDDDHRARYHFLLTSVCKLWRNDVVCQQFAVIEGNKGSTREATTTTTTTAKINNVRSPVLPDGPNPALALEARPTARSSPATMSEQLLLELVNASVARVLVRNDETP